MISETGMGEAPIGRNLMEQLLAEPDTDVRTLKYGDVLEGIVMQLDRDEVLVDIGSKSEGIIPNKELSSLGDAERKALSSGDTVLVFVVQPENADGHAVLSIDRARQEKSWRVLQQKYEASEVIEAIVKNYNKGGLLVDLDGVRGFVPASQVTEIRGGDEASKQGDMARLIGMSIPLKVIEINRHRNRLILSERQAIQERRDAMKERLIGTLKEGEVRKGRVSSICDFGAFVDIGGADGLVHLSELSWSRVRHPSEVLKVGEEVEVYVLGINEDERKIALSLKRTQAEPWTRVAAQYEVGQLVKGTITQLANFGAFARIQDGIEGLIHVSELSDDRVAHPRNVVKEGDEMTLRIIRIDPQRRRMGLSLRRALEFTEQDAIDGYVQDNMGHPVKPEDLDAQNERNLEMQAAEAQAALYDDTESETEGADDTRGGDAESRNDDGPLTATIGEQMEAAEEPTTSPDPDAVAEQEAHVEAKDASGDLTVSAHGMVTMDAGTDVGAAVSSAGADETPIEQSAEPVPETEQSAETGLTTEQRADITAAEQTAENETAAEERVKA
ncbi:MAG: 30S ribosomal protein S1 [Thermomicrobiales bacterium]